MSKNSKPFILILSLLVLLAVIVMPGNTAEQKKPVKVPGWSTKDSYGITECWCPSIHIMNCRCVWYDPTGGGPDSPVSPHQEPENE